MLVKENQQGLKQKLVVPIITIIILFPLEVVHMDVIFSMFCVQMHIFFAGNVQGCLL